MALVVIRKQPKEEKRRGFLPSLSFLQISAHVAHQCHLAHSFGSLGGDLLGRLLRSKSGAEDSCAKDVFRKLERSRGGRTRKERQGATSGHIPAGALEHKLYLCVSKARQLGFQTSSAQVSH